MPRKNILKWLGIAILTPILLIGSLFALFYFPPFQNWAVRRVAAYASEKTGMEISVAHVNLEFPLNLGIEGVKVIQQNDSLPQVKDTVAYIGKAVVDIQLLPLMESEVVVNALEFNHLQVNTADLVHSARIKGNVGLLKLADDNSLNWHEQLVDAGSLRLEDARLSIELSDTVPPDTTPSKNFWKVKARHLMLKNTDFTLHMPGDSIAVNAYFGHTTAQNTFLDLGHSYYTVGQIDWQGGHVHYDRPFEGKIKGFDYNHLSLNELSLKADSFSYGGGTLDIVLRQGRFMEKSGLTVKELAGPFHLDSTRLSLPRLALRTTESNLRADIDMDLNAFDDRHPGKLTADLHGSLGKQDLLLFMQELPDNFKRRWPSRPLRIDGKVRGNMQKAHLNALKVQLPNAFTITTTGFVGNLIQPEKLQADLKVDARTYDIGFLTGMLPRQVRQTVRIPNGIGVKGRFNIDGAQYAGNFTATEGGGSVEGRVALDTRRMAYTARLNARRLPLQHFLPRMGLHPFTGYIDAKGVGTDMLSPRTRLQAKARITRFNYGGYNLDHIHADATISGGKIHALVHSRNPLLQGDIAFDALTRSRNLRATISADLAKADLYRLKIADQPLTATLCGHVDVATDLRDFYKVQGTVTDLTIRTDSQTYRPDDMVLDILTRRDTTHAIIDSGDFHLNMDAGMGYKRLFTGGNRLMAELQKQYTNRIIDQSRLRATLPDARIFLTTGHDNFFVSLLAHYGYTFRNAYVDLSSSPTAGLNGIINVDSLVTGGMQLDTVRLRLLSTDTGMTYSGQIRNAKDNPQYVFNGLFNGSITERGTAIQARLFDEHDRLGLLLGLAADMEAGGIRAHFNQADPILGYKRFHVNDDNYLFLGDDRRVSAHIELKDDDGTGLQIFSNDSNTEALQDVTVSLHKFNLDSLTAVIPYMPNVSGVMNGDFHVVQTSEQLSVSSAVTVDNMAYEHSAMGNIGTEFVYMPKADGSHYVDGILMSDDNEVATIKGTYDTHGYLDATLGLKRLPLSYLNGFIPEKIIGFKGYGEGELTLKGSPTKPHVDGEVYLDSSYLVSEPYGVAMRFANDPVRIEDSRLLFENFEMFANNASPLDISGYYDFSNLDRMMMSVRMRAQNFQIIDAKENPRSEAYGKAFINFFGTMQGPVDNLRMRGMVNVLGTTDMTYVLRDSELATDTQLDELVKFTDFNDSTIQVVKRPPLTGFDMQLSLNIDEAAHIVCMLNADHTNYIDLMGGGDLRMSYNPNDNLRLNGRYTLNNGEMKYSLPIIPLKTFNIQNGSYIEFTGDPMDPRLSIKATENVKATVNEGTGNGRVVDFTCGVSMTQTLAKPGIQFIIDAPNDMTIQDELNTMTAEGRGKVAITMLASGMYLTDGNTGAFSMNSALSSFLQGEINNIAGSAMRSMGLDIGMSIDNATTSSGAMHTDYNFKFSKRLWNNRLSVIVGGKVSSGAEMTEQQTNNTFFDNVELQYRLNQNASQYLRLFYNNNTYDWLEGQIGIYGAGFMWRRKLEHFRDIFKFKADKPVVPTDEKKDTLKTAPPTH